MTKQKRPYLSQSSSRSRNRSKRAHGDSFPQNQGQGRSQNNKAKKSNSPFTISSLFARSNHKRNKSFHEIPNAACDLHVGGGQKGRLYRHALDLARGRMILSGIVFLFCILGVSSRLIYIGYTSDGGEPVSALDSPSAKFHQGRADILDRNGVVLATTITTSSLYANAKRVMDAEKAARLLKTVLPRYSEQKLLKKMQSDRTFIWLARHLTPRQRDRVMALGIPGIGFRKDFKRLYPHGSLAAHVIGLTNIDDQGIAGIEKSYEHHLLTSGEPVRLALDIRAQHAMRDELLKGMEEFSATGASAILMDMKTEEIVGLVSVPDFNPNHPDEVKSGDTFNKATVGMYEMGSTFKILNTAMALDTNDIQLTTEYDTSAEVKLGRFRITDYRASYGQIPVAKIFVFSSNKGSLQMALACGTEHQQKFMKAVGNLNRCPLEIPETGRPIVPKHWRDANTVTISYGYGLAVSPLHLLNSVASVVYDGCKKSGTLLKKQESDTFECERIVSADVAFKMRQLMRLVVLKGTSKKANIPGYYLAAKTGTRNMLEPNGSYNKNRVSTTFVGLIGETVKKPRYLLVVLLEDPKGLKKTFGFTAAGWNAAPIGGRILGRIAPLMGIKPTPQLLDQSFEPVLQQMDFSKKKKG